VNAVVADAKGVAYEWAAAIARAPASAVQATKRLASFRRRLTAPERELIEDMRALVEQKREFLKPRSDV
jgi:DNA replication initiation complex subunit (GINS family)